MSTGPPGGPVFTVYRVVAGLFSLGVLAQAVLAGQFLNGQGGLIAAHRAIGTQVLPSLALAMVVLVLLLRGPVRSKVLVAVSVVLLALTTLQTGLGFLGRRSLGSAAAHVPLGVALFGITVYNMSVVRDLVRRSRPPA